jgi:hypothetical protein
MKKDGGWASNNLEKANIFAQYLEKIFHPNPGLDTLPIPNSNDYLDKMPLISPREVAERIKTYLNPQKAPRFDLVREEILKNFKRKALVKPTTLINACIPLNCIPDAWKSAEVIMIPKPGKNISEVESDWANSLLSIMSKLFDKLIFQRLKPIIAE